MSLTQLISNGIRVSCVLTALLSLCCFTVLSQEDAGGFTRGKKELGQIISFQFSEKRLRLNRTKWKKEKEEKKTDVGLEKELREKWAKKLMMKPEDVPEAFLKMDLIEAPTGGLPKLFEAFMNRASGERWGGSSGSSQSGNKNGLTRSKANLSASMDWLTDFTEFRLKIKELVGKKRMLTVEEDPVGGLLIRYEDPARKNSILLVQSIDGNLSSTIREGAKNFSFNGQQAKDFFLKAPDQVYAHLLRPLTQMGIGFEPHRYHPLVIALATTGFSSPTPEIQSNVDRWVAELGHDEHEVREAATVQLMKVFPKASYLIVQALKKEQELESKIRLKRIIAAHPERGRMYRFVLKEKLHEDQGYLIDILEKSPAYRSAARKRLTHLVGKDYGDSPGDWPPQKEKVKK